MSAQISKRRPGEAMGGATVADPRPRLDGKRVLGARCRACGYPTAPAAPWCPACHARELDECAFGPGGAVFSSTIVHIPVGKHRPPYGLAYVDLDDGPRILAHLTAPEILAPGTRVRIVGGDEDVIVEKEEAP